MESTGLAKIGFRSFLAEYSGRFVAQILVFLTSLLVIRQLTVEEFGTYRVFSNLWGLGLLLAVTGISSALNRFVPELWERGQFDRLRRVIWGGAIGGIVPGAIFAVGVIFLEDWLISVLQLPVDVRASWHLFAILILITVESRVLQDGVLAGLLEQPYLNVARVAYGAVKLGLFYVALKLGQGVPGLIKAWVASEFLLLVLFVPRVAMSITVGRGEARAAANYPTMGEMTRFGLFTYLSALIVWFRDWSVDSFILSYYLGPAAVGRYSFVMNISNQLVMMAPGTVILPIAKSAFVRKYTQAEDEGTLGYLFQLYGRIAFFSGIPILSGVAILSDKVIQYVFGPQYLDLSLVLSFYLLPAAVRLLAYPLDAAIRTSRHTQLFLLSALGSVCNVLLDLWLIPILGVEGALIAAAVGLVVSVIGQYYLYQRITGVSYPFRSFARMTANVVCMGTVVFVLRRWVNNLTSLMAVVAIGAAVYLVCSLVNKAFEERDRELFNRAIGVRVFR